MRLRLPALALCLLLASCTEEEANNEPPPPEPPPKEIPRTADHLLLVGGNLQTGAVGTTLPKGLAVRVVDKDGAPLGGVSLRFAALVGGGSVGTALVTSDTEGLAATTFTLGPAPGIHTVGVGRDGVPMPDAAATGNSTLTFNETAVHGEADHLELVGGDGQTGEVGSELPMELEVRVVDRFGNPAGGTTMAFTVSGGGGTALPPSAVSGAAGLAATRFTLGASPGLNALIAGRAVTALPDLAASGRVSITFLEHAVAGPADHLLIVEGDGQTAEAGAALPVDPTVQVVDQLGNAVAGTPLHFTATAGGGSVDPDSATSGPTGLAWTTFTLGPAPGANALEVAGAGTLLPGLAGSAQVSFAETAVAGPADHLVYLSGDGQTGQAGFILPAPLEMRVVDRKSNGVPGTALLFTVLEGGGGTYDDQNRPTSVVTSDAAGLVKNLWRMGQAGRQRLVVERQGTPLPDLAVTGRSTLAFLATSRAWETVDDFRFAETDDSAALAGGVDTHGDLYVVGSGQSPAGARWLVRKSSDGGATWQVVDDFQLDPGRDAGATAFAADAAGSIFVAGWAYDPYTDAGYAHRWLVRKSGNGGASWTTVDSFWYDDNSAGYVGGNARPSALAALPSGSLVAVGYATDPISAEELWVVRQSDPGGGSWVEIDSFQRNPAGQQRAEAVTAAGGYIYVAGHAWGSHPWLTGAGDVWLCREYADGCTGSGCWRTIAAEDSDQRYAFAHAIAADAGGNLYVLGWTQSAARGPWKLSYGTRSGSVWSWSNVLIPAKTGEARQVTVDGAGTIHLAGVSTSGGSEEVVVMRGTKSGSTWSWAQSRLTYSAGEDAGALGMFADAQSVVWAVGYGGKGGQRHWLTFAGSAGSWELLDDFQRGTEQDSFARGFGHDPTRGDAYVVGYALGILADHWIVRRSQDGGSAWETVDDYRWPDGESVAPAYASAVAVDKSGNVFVAGAVGLSGAPGGVLGDRWMVRRSADGGARWETVDQFTRGDLGTTIAGSAAADSTGKIYVAGWASDGSRNHWIVRASGDGGSSWTTADDHATSDASQSFMAGGVAVDNSDVVYVAGEHDDFSARVTRWFMRMSLDRGLSWQSIESEFGNSSTDDHQAWTVKTDHRGWVYVGGYERTGNGKRWLVKRSTNRGASWTAIDSFSLGPAVTHFVIDLAIEPSGVLWVAGYVDDAGASRWVLRRSTDGGQSWVESDWYQRAPGAPAWPSALGIGPGGRLFHVGAARDGDGRTHWITRRF